MPDVVDSATRSRMMSGIRSKNTKPEITVRRLLHRLGFRFRLHVKELPGKPDIVLPRYRAVVQVNGCFWHMHECNLFKWPGTRIQWWHDKLERNRANDTLSTASLHDAGWKVATVWECALKGRERLEPEHVGRILSEWLKSEDTNDLDISGGAE